MPVLLGDTTQSVCSRTCVVLGRGPRWVFISVDSEEVKVACFDTIVQVLILK
jgi:hypothetical protein